VRLSCGADGFASRWGEAPIAAFRLPMSQSGVVRACLLVIFLAAALLPSVLEAQDAGQTMPPPSVAERWRFFASETMTPFTLVSGAVNGSVSQATGSDPRYGVGAGAYADRFGASVVDVGSQNFFTDFVMASVLHEDTRYRRRGPRHRFWSRVGYAVSRALITRTDAGGCTFNWSNFIGAALSAGFSNAYYPAPSRTGGAMIINWANSVAGTGFGNLLPEFLPDFKRWLKRRHL